MSIKKLQKFICQTSEFANEFYGLKFYWKGVEKSKNRYSLLTNDYEPRTIVRSCIEVMMEYFRKNRMVSFGFVAAPDLDKDIEGKKVDKKTGSRRFKFYRRMMINLFGPETFYQVSDTTNTIYLLVNMIKFSNKCISLKEIEHKINQAYLGDYIINSD